MKRKILFIVLLLFLSTTKARALTYAGCSYSDIAKLRAYVDNINLYYDYRIDGNMAFFNITLTNVPQNVYFVDTKKGNTYTYNNTNNGEITLLNYFDNKGQFQFYSALGECYGINLGSKYYNLPTYNEHYDSDICREIPEFSLCKKWVSSEYSYDEFMRLAERYRNEGTIEPEKEEVEYSKNFVDYIVDFYVKYYYIILGSIIVIFGSIIIIKSRKEKFDI